MNDHNAPPVVYPVGRSHFHACVLLAFWAGGAVAVWWWIRNTAMSQGVSVLAGLLVAVLGGLAFRAWAKAPHGQLAWDGEVWRWQSAGYQAGEATYRLTAGADFQRVLLLRLENSAAASIWLWADAARQPDRWLDLRRAVYLPGRSSRGVRRESPASPGAGQAVAVSGAMQPPALPFEKPQTRQASVSESGRS